MDLLDPLLDLLCLLLDPLNLLALLRLLNLVLQLPGLLFDLPGLLLQLLRLLPELLLLLGEGLLLLTELRLLALLPDQDDQVLHLLELWVEHQLLDLAELTPIGADDRQADHLIGREQLRLLLRLPVELLLSLLLLLPVGRLPCLLRLDQRSGRQHGCAQRNRHHRLPKHDAMRHTEPPFLRRFPLGRRTPRPPFPLCVPEEPPVQA